MARYCSTWSRPTEPPREAALPGGSPQYDVPVRFELVQRLHAPIEAVEEALTDPRFLETLGTLPKLGRPKLLERRDDGNRVFQRVRYDFEGNLSPAVKAVVDPSKLSWVEESTQDRTTHRTAITIVPDNYTSIFGCSGSARLTTDAPTGDTVRITTGDVSVRVPFVSGRAESAIISGLQEHAVLEEEALNGWVKARRNAGHAPDSPAE